MTLTPFFIIVLPLFALVTVGLIGSTRRSGFWPTLLLGVILTPVGGFVVAWLSGPRRYAPRRRRTP